MFYKKRMCLWAISAFSINGFAQHTLNGTVQSAANELLPGAVVTLERSYAHQATDVNGKFEFKNLRAGTYVLYTRLLGFKEHTDTVEISSDKSLDVKLEIATISIDEVVVNATRAGENSGMAYNSVSKKEIEKQNLGTDVPYVLNMLPSTVVSSDAGAGVGYTGIRIRGTDPTRINVTINGIPVNDAESQGTYWVDMPDLLSSTDNIQVQRGLGTSTNGSGAFGGSINIQSDKLNAKPYAEVNNSFGSFNTMKNTIKGGSGLIGNHFTVDARLSRIASDGFLDRAYSDMLSAYLSTGYYGEKTSIKLIALLGKEKTYQAWNGTPEGKLKGNDTLLTTHYYNNLGYLYHTAEDSVNLFTSNSRTYNQFTYENQTDNYWQYNYQLLFTHAFNRHLNFNFALHYTRGLGYYEEYRTNEALLNYDFDTSITSDLVRRKWLDNDFFGRIWSLNYTPSHKFSLTLGGASNKYIGDHFGRVVWADNFNVDDYEYYRNQAKKTEVNSFLKMNVELIKGLNVFGDLQVRNVDYVFQGFDTALVPQMQNVDYLFFNPKFGINYNITKSFKIYLSYGVGHKEPNRGDFVESTPLSRPKPETLKDFEMGITHEMKKFRYTINMFDMTYENQLVLTGKINDVGAYVRTNIAESYRRGFEFELGWMPIKYFEWAANLTLSDNKVVNFTEYIDDYDIAAQVATHYSKADIAFSPSTIAANQFMFNVYKGLQISFLTKYVGEQYLDNTSNKDRMLDAFLVNDVRINYSYKLGKVLKELSVILAVNNFLNEQYESNGYTYSYRYGSRTYTENFYYPQAGINFMAGLGLKF